MTRGLYFDDLAVGMSETSPRRTVTEADVVAFAGLSGDFNPLHTDAVYAQESPFGRRVAHGLLGTAIASGLFTRTALSAAIQPGLVAMLGVDVRFAGPLFIGDTVHVRATISELRDTSKPERGIVVISRVLENQEGDTVQEAVTPMLIQRSAG